MKHGFGGIALLSATWLVATACAGQDSRHTESQTTSTEGDRQYLMFWAPTQRVVELRDALATKRQDPNRLLGFGVVCSTFDEERRVDQKIHDAFATARKNNLAVMLHFDFHVDWSTRPDLWNWFDPTKPGYKPENKKNVEWFGWDGPPAKARYLNWGEAQKMPPPLCYTSTAVRAEWHRLISKVVAPPIKKELAALKSEGKENLFAGVLVGSEPTFDNYTHTDPETAKLAAEDGSPTGQLGYRALLDSGFSQSHPPEDIHRALGKVIHDTVEYWCKEFTVAGISKDKLYPHVPAGADMETTSAPAEAAVNNFSRPGWSTYPVGPLQRSFQPLYSALSTGKNPHWGGVEANLGFPGTLVDWETYLGWHYNHGATLVGINIGATGTDLPAKLEKSAFSEEAKTAYRKFLAGDKLTEKPVQADEIMPRIKEKMELLQAGFREWQRGGRDPSPIAHFVEDRLPALLKEGKLSEAEAVLDEALKRIKSVEKTGQPSHRTTQ